MPRSISYPSTGHPPITAGFQAPENLSLRFRSVIFSYIGLGRTHRQAPSNRVQDAEVARP